MSPEEFAAFARTAPWTFAKTMPQTPHEYTLRKHHIEHVFEAAVACIRRHGFRYRWRGHSAKHYLVVDGKKYWTMGAPVHQTVVLNRADLEPGDQDRQLQASAFRQQNPGVEPPVIR